MKTLLFTLGIFMLTPIMSSANDANDVQDIVQNIAQDSDGNIYQTVKIGEQTWLTENLRTTTFQDHSKVSTGFIPNDDENQLLTYGRLYNWHDVTDERRICPVGWRGENDIAITLKAAQPNTFFKSFDQTQVNKYKFSAQPAGVKLGNWYITQGMYTEFWTSSSATNKDAYARTLAYSWWNSHKGEIRRARLTKSHMFSVRCVKN